MQQTHSVAGRQLSVAMAILALIALLTGGLVASRQTAAQADSTTISNDLLRTGWYPDQPTLTASAVQTGGSFGQLFSAAVDGQVYGQPLVSNNTLLVTTQNNNAYGLDPRTGAQRWTDNFGPPFVPATFTKTQYCTDIRPNVGITATPVVDPSTGLEYLTSKTYLADGTTPVWYLHALSVATGAEQPGWPVKIDGAADNNPADVFNAGLQLQRPGLLLSNGVIYAAFGAHCDYKPYEGWVFGISTAAKITARWSDEATASPTDSLGPGAGIWAAGGGLVSDGPGQMILSTGNGVTLQSPTPGSNPPGNLGQSVVRLSAQPDGSLKATDFFTPYNATSLNANDTDLGSGGPVGLPPQEFGTAAHPNLVLEVGKSGYIYVLDAKHLGGYQQGPSGSDAVINTVQGGGVWGHPAVWGGDGGWVYITTAQGGKGSGTLRAYKYALDGNGNPTLAYQARTADSFGFSSSSPTVTSDGTASGTALVWTVWAPDATGAGAQLRAYNPIPVNGVLQQVVSFPIGTSTKFTPPSVSAGVVYTGTLDGHVLGFGSPVASPLTGNAITFPPTTVGSTSHVTETVTANQALTVTGVSTNSTVFGTAATTPPLPANLAKGATLNIPVSFTPSGGGLAATTLRIDSNAGSISLPVSGQGQTASASLVADTVGLSFGGVQDGTQASETVTYTNQGASTLHITGEQLPSAPYSVAGLPAVGSTLGANQSVTATVTFSPKQVGYYTNNLTIDSDGGTNKISLDGSGGTPPALQISNQSLQYGQVPEGVRASLTFTLHNSGGTVLTIEKSKPPLGANGFTAVNPDPEGTTIDPGQTLTERVDFTPGAIGAVASTWTINANDNLGVRTIDLNGTGTTPPVPTLVVGDTDVTSSSSAATTAAFPLFLSPGAANPVTDSYKTGDGSLKSGVGYVPTSGSVTVTPGQTSTVSATVNAGAPTGKFYLLALPQSGTNVADNGAAYVSTTPLKHDFIIANSTSVWRSPSATMTAHVPITLQSPATTNVAVTATTADGTAHSGADYSVTTKATVIPSGQTAVDFAVPILANVNQTTPLTFNVTLSGTNGATKIAAGTATVTIYPPSSNVSTPPPSTTPVFTADTPNTTATVGGGYSYAFAATGNPTPAFSVPEGGTLPPGLTLDPTGILAGTPTAAGIYSFSVSATNSAGTATTQAITITVGNASSPAVFTADSPPSAATVGSAYSYTFAASGNPNPTFDVSSGGLPPGLTLYTQTGQLAGTPTTAGTYTFVVEAINGIDAPAESPTLTIRVGTGTVTAPGAPTSVSAAPGTGQATVKWTAPVSNGGSPITGYIVTPYIGTSAEPARRFSSTATQQTITGLTSGTSYTFKVAAFNSAGTGPASGASNAVQPK